MYGQQIFYQASQNKIEIFQCSEGEMNFVQEGPHGVYDPNEDELNSQKGIKIWGLIPGILKKGIFQCEIVLEMNDCQLQVACFCYSA